MGPVVVKEESIGLGGGEDDGDVVCVGVEGWERHVGELVEAEGRALAVTAVATFWTAAAVAVNRRAGLVIV